jgi:protein-disulfide isomerase
VIENYPEEVKVVYKNFPIRSHRFSEPAAKAALAAHRQGKFWPFHDLLYQNYNNLSNEKIREIAQSLQLDMARFEKDWQDPAIAAKVEADQRDGSQAGVRGVPTIFINGRRLKQRSLEGFSQMIEEALQSDKGSTSKK